MHISSVSLRQRAAFTLMEMAVVLAIIGLLVGAVVGGQELIRQSEAQTVVSDYSKYIGAITQFRQQYGSLPGDILDATNFWGDDNANCADASVTNGTPGTCNGNGDGDISNPATEPYRAWQQLMLAKYIEGNYTGVSPMAAGTSVPRSRIQNAAWSLYNNTTLVGNATWYAQDLGNLLAFGATAAFVATGPVITSSDAWQIDKKMDDGNPAYGKVVALKPTFASTPDCATTAVDATAVYKTTYTGIACSLMISLGIK